MSLSLLGCATHKQPPVAAPGDNATVKLAEAAASIDKSLLQLKEIQAAATPPAKGKHLPDPQTFGMHEKASVDWHGPVGPIVKRLAKAASFKLRVLGHPPAIPVLVSVNAKNSMLGNILRDVDFQAGHKADIVVYPKSRVIELRYAKA